ncbi:CPBP family intramembrane metalloprotease [Staphylococcus muscae]|uniref:CAAX amino protease n=1 Tax=Staphylococcus muscae TaxID=1294 RepID=A0A240C5N3_9STAP|nr:CPBP family intramembrane glutamic endopeptidase [Staphylococcus muscae]AVQ33457.1 CPBP family intramembrane metalloprotease [Staphylococcus muscae]PNZ01070.1 CPBP family intramembrane metalloprotease [Staphylococcus muscae]GGA90366.1 CAAX amino protease [Staphylococcus muscae]SNW03294.1 metal-dependent membrane protease [Staphylococcus muscae]
MNRIIVSILTVVIYITAQLSPRVALMAGWIDKQSATEQLQQVTYIQVIVFIVAALLILFMQPFIKNPFAFELQRKEEKRYIVVWILVGLVIVFIAQIITNLISAQLLGVNPASENTMRIMRIARQMPILIILIAIVGPLLEEFVFRKVIFGEIYNAIKASPVVKFTIATTVSSTIFAVAHADLTHFAVYFVMGVIFSGFYIYTKRLSVAIGIHMAQNALVALIQFSIPEEVMQKAIEQAQFILYFI